MAEEPYWTSVKWEYDSSGEPLYLGKHKTEGASPANTGWYIWKWTADASGNVQVQGPKINAWDKRTTLW